MKLPVTWSPLVERLIKEASEWQSNSERRALLTEAAIHITDLERALLSGYMHENNCAYWHDNQFACTCALPGKEIRPR